MALRANEIHHRLDGRGGRKKFFLFHFLCCQIEQFESAHNSFFCLINYAKMIFRKDGRWKRGWNICFSCESLMIFRSMICLAANNNKTIKLWTAAGWEREREMRWLKWRLNSDKYIRIMFQFCFFLMIRKMKWNILPCHSPSNGNQLWGWCLRECT